MKVKHRIVRTLGTAGVGLFLVAGVAFGANAIGQAPGRATDTTLTTSDETASPAAPRVAEPTETADPTKTAEPNETAEPAETAEPTETAEPMETAEPAENAEDQNKQGNDATGTAEPIQAAEPTESPDDHGDGSGHDGGASGDSGHDGGGHD